MLTSGSTSTLKCALCFLHDKVELFKCISPPKLDLKRSQKKCKEGGGNIERGQKLDVVIYKHLKIELSFVEAVMEKICVEES